MRLLLFALSLAAAVYSLSGCSKSDSGDGLPAATHAGNNILAFRIDGVAYVAQGKHDGRVGLFTSPYAAAELYNGDTVGNVICYGTTPQSFSLQVWGQGHAKLQPFTLAPSYGRIQFDVQQDLFSPDGSEAGYLSFDYVNDSVLAGTFELTLHSAITGRAVHLTDGRFDVGR